MAQSKPISLVIPIHDFNVASTSRMANAILTQKLLPQEIILVNTSNENVEVLIAGLKQKFQDRLSVIVVPSKHSYPGKARNIGVETSQNAYIAFLDILTVPSPEWLRDSYTLISEKKCDGVIGRCNFIGGTFFSWILIDSLFGRGPISTFPGSIFKREGLRRVGPMVEKVRAGEDNEWLQRAQLMEVKFLHSKNIPVSAYYGYEQISFISFCRKWTRNYLAAAKLPQYKLIYQFNMIMWIAMALTAALNWNSIFADWDTSHPMYLPHITKITAVSCLLSYAIVRVIYLPIKRSSPWKKILSYRALFIFLLVLTADALKSWAFLMSAFRPQKKYDSEESL